MTTFFNITESQNKEAALASACSDEKLNIPNDLVFHRDVFSFTYLPNESWSYFIDEQLIDIYCSSTKMKDFSLIARQGLTTGDNVRFFRLTWEITQRQNRWNLITKGGAAEPYYSDIPLCINWKHDGKEVLSFAAVLYGSPTRTIKNIPHYFRPGLTWSNRANALAMRLVPKNCIFDRRGSCVFAHDDNEETLFYSSAILNSAGFSYAIGPQLQMMNGGARFECGTLEETPFPEVSDEDILVLASWAKENYICRHELDIVNEESHAFLLPELLINRLKPEWNRKTLISSIADNHLKTDELVDACYGINSPTTEKFANTRLIPDITDKEKINRLMMWAVGVAFGRFEYRLATGDRQSWDVPSPIEPYEERSRGMVQEYDACFVENSGILVQEDSHSLALNSLVSRVFAYIDMEPPVDIDRWLKRDFFEFHKSIYTKFRRCAPIYWPIGTESGNYILWIYFPKLSNQTLYVALNDFINPKIEQLKRFIEQPGTASAETIRNSQDLLAELRILQGKVQALAETYRPYTDDGVEICAAPLRELIQNKKWQKELDGVWKELEKGSYDWSGCALNYWPERAKKAEKDPSIALAHKHILEDGWTPKG